MAGLTFQFLTPVKNGWVTDLSIDVGGDPHKHIAYNGWSTPWECRTELNSGNHFAPSVDAVVKEVVKWSYKNTNSPQVSTNDKVFFLSLYELNMRTDFNFGTGTGSSHDQSYLFYQQVANRSIGYDEGWCWTRTIRENNGYDIWLVQGSNIKLDNGSTRVKSYWLPAFCM